MEQVLATARKVQLRERGRVAEALTASLREGAAAESLSAARTSGRNGAGGETALHFMFYCPQVRARPLDAPRAACAAADRARFASRRTTF